jgi:hypothetical protein
VQPAVAGGWHTTCDPFDFPSGSGRVTKRAPGAALTSQVAVLGRPQKPSEAVATGSTNG